MVRLILFGLFFYLIYFLVKYLFVKPFREGYGAGNPGGGHKQGNWNNPFNRKKEGEVTISYNPNKSQKEDKKVGEYVDYEDVKEK